MSSLSAADFDFELPDELIAQTPAAQRDESRLLLVGQDDVAHHTFAALPDLIERYVGERPLLIVNDSKVLLARLYTRKLAPDGTLGGRVELLPAGERRTQRRRRRASWTGGTTLLRLERGGKRHEERTGERGGEEHDERTGRRHGHLGAGAGLPR